MATRLVLWPLRSSRAGISRLGPAWLLYGLGMMGEALGAGPGGSSPLGSAGLWVCAKGAQLFCSQPGASCTAHLPRASWVLLPVLCSLPVPAKKQSLEFCLNPHPPGNSSLLEPVEPRCSCLRTNGLRLPLNPPTAWHRLPLARPGVE